MFPIVRRSDRVSRRRAVFALLSLGTATLILALLPHAFGRPLRRVQIEWNVADARERQELEQRFKLADARPLQRRVWMYVPTDTTPAVLRSIVEHPAVVATVGIDRRALRMAAHGSLTERRGGWFPGHRMLPRMAKLAAYLLLLFAAGVVAGPFVIQTYGSTIRTTLPKLRANPRAVVESCATALQRGIPEIPPQTAAAFRLIFVPLVLVFVSDEPIDATAVGSSLAAGTEQLSGLQSVVVPWFVAHPDYARVLDSALVVAAALTIAGVLTRISYAAFVAAFTVWACLFSVRTSHHTIVALNVTLIGLLAVPWGDAWSVDALWRRWRGTAALGRASARYGFGVWLPGFVLGVVFLAAAWSKVQNGPAWILNGTVRYHVVTDLQQALVSWGPWLTQNHGIAIVLSAAAVTTEASLMVASFTRSPQLRLALGAAAAALLAGFGLFQGVIWPAWWILLVSFLPWQALHGRSPAVATRSIASPVQMFVILVLLVQQIVISAVHLEMSPLFSAYDMYSATYNSEHDYEAATNLVYQVVTRDAAGDREVPGCIVNDRTAERLLSGSVDIKAVLRSCIPATSGAQAIILRGDRRVYDWDEGRFRWRRGLDLIGPLHVEAVP